MEYCSTKFLNSCLLCTILVMMLTVEPTFQLQAIMLSSDSYSKYPLGGPRDHVLKTTETYKSLMKNSSVIRLTEILVSFTPQSDNGALFCIRFGAYAQSWLAIGTEARNITLFIGQNNSQVMRILTKEQINRNKQQYFKLTFSGLKASLALNQADPINVDLRNKFQNSFNIEEDSVLFLGFDSELNKLLPIRRSLHACVHHVVFNNEFILLSEGAIKSSNIKSCLPSSATDCVKNYCSENGICKKTLTCESILSTNEFITKNGKVFKKEDNSTTNETSIPEKPRWIQIDFDNLVYVHGLSVHSSDVNSHENKTKLRFYLKLRSREKYFNYTVNQTNKVFNANVIFRVHYLTWPVAARSIRIHFLNRLFIGSQLLVRIIGCNQTDFGGILPRFLPPFKWVLAFQSKQNEAAATIWKEFGVVEEGPHLISSFGAGYLQQTSTYKSKLLDVLDSLSGHILTVKVELWNRSQSKLYSAWILNWDDCNRITNKYLILQLVQRLNIFESENKNSKSDKNNNRCAWTKFVSDADVAATEDLIVRVLFRRSFASTDAFKIINHVILNESLVTSNQTVNSVEECTSICLKSTNPVCTAFSVTRQPFSLVATVQAFFECRLTTTDVFASNYALIHQKHSSVYLLSESFQSINAGQLEDKRRRINFAIEPDRGFQCQCLNRFIGSRCDNNSLHQQVYHVIITSRLEKIDLDCRNEKDNLVIGIEFGLLGVSNNFTQSVSPFDVTSDVSNSLGIVKAICEGRKVCRLTIELIASLLPPRNYSYLEVRYICDEPNKISVSFDPLFLSKLIKRREARKRNKLDNQQVALEQNNETQSKCKHCRNSTVHSQTSSEVKYDVKPTLVTALSLENGSDLARRPFFVTHTYFNKETTMQDIVSLTSSIRHTSAITSPATLTETQTSAITATILLQNQTNVNSVIANLFIDIKNNLTKTIQCAMKESGVGLLRAEKTSCSTEQQFNISAAGFYARQLLDALLSANASNLQPDDVINSVKLVQKLLELNVFSDKSQSISSQDLIKRNENFVKTMMLIVNILVDEKLLNVWDGITKHLRSTAAYNLTQSVDRLGMILADTKGSKMFSKYILSNVAFQVLSVKVPILANDRIFLTFSNQQSANKSTNATPTWSANTGSVTLPVDQNISQSNNIVFVVYKSLEKLLGNTYAVSDPFSNSTLSNVHNYRDVISHVMSIATQPKTRKFYKKNKINIIFRHKSEKKANVTCVFWKHGKLSTHDFLSVSGGYWSNDGCVTMTSNSSHTVCECDHLTNFAILMNASGVKIDEVHNYILTLITWIGCSASITCLLLCLFCFLTLGGIQSTRNTIHKNLCFTLLLAQSIFLLGVKKTQEKILCPLIAGSLHYLFLCVFAWMSVEGLHIYVSLVKIFKTEKPSRLLSYYIFAYGFPALVVAVSAALRFDGYGTNESCWLAADGDYLIWSFVGPALCVICVNIYFFVVALSVMHTHRRVNNPDCQTHMAETKLWIRGSAVLLCLLGIPWIFGVFFVNTKTVIMAYIFTSCNASQGVFIFLFHCLFNEKVRTELVKCFRRSKLCSGCVRKRYSMNNPPNARTGFSTTSLTFLKTRRSSSTTQDSLASPAKSWFIQTSSFTNNNDSNNVAERRRTPYWKETFLNENATVQVSNEKVYVNYLESSKPTPNAEDSTTFYGNQEEKSTPSNISKPTSENEECQDVSVITHSPKILSISNCGNKGFCEEDHAYKSFTPDVERRERVERFYQDYAKHFGANSEKKQQGVYRNKSMPANIQQGKEREARFREKQQSGSLYFSMGLNKCTDHPNLKSFTNE